MKPILLTLVWDDRRATVSEQSEQPWLISRSFDATPISEPDRYNGARTMIELETIDFIDRDNGYHYEAFGVKETVEEIANMLDARTMRG